MLSNDSKENEESQSSPTFPEDGLGLRPPNANLPKLFSYQYEKRKFLNLKNFIVCFNYFHFLGFFIKY